MERGRGQRLSKINVEVLDEDEQRAVINELKIEADRSIARESLSVAVLCGVLALISAGLGICEMLSPWSNSLPHAVLRNSLPHWGVVANHAVGSLAQLASLFVVYLPETCKDVDFLAISFFLSVGSAVVWLTALLLSGHLLSWPALFIVVNPATFLLAWASVHERQDMKRSILDMRQSMYKFKNV